MLPRLGPSGPMNGAHFGQILQQVTITYIYINVYIYMYVCVWTYVYIYLFIEIGAVLPQLSPSDPMIGAHLGQILQQVTIVYIYIYIYIYIERERERRCNCYINICMYMCVCRYIYIYIYIYIYREREREEGERERGGATTAESFRSGADFAANNSIERVRGSGEPDDLNPDLLNLTL